LGRDILLGLRPSDLYITPDHRKDDCHFEAKVEFVELLGKNAYITFSHGELSLVGEVMGRDLPTLGQNKKLTLNLDHAHLFDAESGKNLIL